MIGPAGICIQAGLILVKRQEFIGKLELMQVAKEVS